MPVGLQDRVEEAIAMGWRQAAPPHRLAILDHLSAGIAGYPEDHRILPTRLGNILRGAEDTLPNDGGDLEGYVLRSYDQAPSGLKEQHDQFRNRLDMYCTLVFVCVVLAALSAGLLGTGAAGWTAAATAAATFLVLAAVSYSAAIASARGLGTVLQSLTAAQQAPVRTA